MQLAVAVHDYDQKPEGPQGLDWNLVRLRDLHREIVSIAGKSAQPVEPGGEIELNKLATEAFQQARRIVSSRDVLPRQEDAAREIAQNLADTLKAHGFEDTVPSKKSSDPHSQIAAGWLFNNEL